MDEIVWLFEERRYAKVLRVEAHFIIVEYEENGDTVHEAVENDDYEYWREHTIDYEHD